MVEQLARTLCVGGQNGVDASGSVMGDFAEETTRAVDNARVALAAAGGRLSDVISWTVAIVHGQDLRAGFGAMQPALAGREHPLIVTELWLDRWSGLIALDRDDPAVRSLTAERVVRVRTPHSLVQLRVQNAASGTTIAFHEEHLPDEQTRNVRKAHWTQVLADLESHIPDC